MTENSVRVRELFPCPSGYREIGAGESLAPGTLLYDRQLLAEGLHPDSLDQRKFLGWTDYGWIRFNLGYIKPLEVHTEHFWYVVRF